MQQLCYVINTPYEGIFNVVKVNTPYEGVFNVVNTPYEDVFTVFTTVSKFTVFTYEGSIYQRCDLVYTKLVDIVYRVSCIHVHTRNFINTRKYIHEIFSLN